MKLSVIVPCYNVSNSIRSTIESIINNKIADMEILVIDDASTDDTYEILESLAKQYKQVRVLKHKKNKGLSGARNTGIRKALGEYLSFIDAGDTIKPLMYKDMLKKASSKDFDIVVCDEERIFPTYRKKVSSGVFKDCFNRLEIKNASCFMYPSACNKIYKRAIFKDILFKEGVWFEDVEYLYRYIPHTGLGAAPRGGGGEIGHLRGTAAHLLRLRARHHAGHPRPVDCHGGCRVHHRLRLRHGAADAASQTAAGLFHCEQPLLYPLCPHPDDARGHDGGHDPYALPRRDQDHPVLLRRRDPL